MADLSKCKFFASRLLGQNRFFSVCGAMLDVGLTENIDQTSKSLVVEFDKFLATLPIQGYEIITNNYSNGFSVIVRYPYDLLHAMCDIMDRFWEGFVQFVDNKTPMDIERLTWKAMRFINTDQNLVVREIYLKAQERKINFFVYEGTLVLGSGIHQFSVPIKDLQNADKIPWDTIKDIPIVIVSGTNGKTTTARLTEYVCRNSGMKTGQCDSDFVNINGNIVLEGDLSGPTGHQLVLMNKEVEVAVLEVARGGLVKRGLLPNYAVAATVTNIAHDHIGQGGIENLTDLAKLKGVVFSGVKEGGTKIINLDDENLVNLTVTGIKAYVSTKLNEEAISKNLTTDNFVVFIADGAVVLKTLKDRYQLNKINEIPLTVQGLAKYNYENILHSVGLLYSLGLGIPQIIDGLARFGSDEKSNFGRWNYYKTKNNGHMVVDTAHNPAGLKLVLNLAHDFRKLHNLNGRVGLMYGITGDRREMAEELTSIIIDNNVDQVVIKEILTALRGSQIGEMPLIFKNELIKQGYPENKIVIVPSELDNAKFILAQSNPEDIYILCVHEMVHEVIDLMKASV